MVVRRIFPTRLASLGTLLWPRQNRTGSERGTHKYFPQECLACTLCNRVEGRDLKNSL